MVRLTDTRFALFGGRGVGGGRMKDLWAFDTSTGEWEQLSDGTAEESPCAKESSALVVLPHTGDDAVAPDLLCLYGFDGERELAEVHRFDASARRWQDVTGRQTGQVPSARSGFATASTRKGDHGSAVFMLGGELDPAGPGTFTNAVHTLNVRGSPECAYTWNRSASHRIEGRGWLGAAVHEGQIVAVGGRAANNVRFGGEWASTIAALSPEWPEVGSAV